MNPDVNKPPTCFNVYNPDTILWMANLIDHGILVAMSGNTCCFIEKIKPFSYN